MESKNLPIGTTLQSGKYTIEQVIGDGGFGITYYVRHNVLGHYFAIKEFFISGYCTRIPQSYDVSPQRINETAYEKYLYKFIEEAQILAKLNHPNIVKVTDIFQENNTAYMVMPYVSGKTLQQIVNEKGRLNYEKAVNYVAQLSEAISYIHRRDILHRDIKPDNVIITEDDKAILIDFGSARAFFSDKAQQHTAIYTKGYAPLEQYSFDGKKSACSDIYSLGAVFYFTLTGKKPMDASLRTMEKMQEPQSLVSSIPDEANHTIMKAMQLNPENRYQNIKEFMDDLLNNKKTGRKNKKKPVLFNRFLLALAMSLFLALLIIMAAEWIRNNNKNNNGGEVITLLEEKQAEPAPDSLITDGREIVVKNDSADSAKRQTANDTIRGDFDGNGTSEYMWLESPKVSHTADSTGICDSCVCYIKFSDSRIPSIKIEHCTGGQLVNEGDLNKNKSDEIGFLANLFTNCWKIYYVWTFIAGQWEEAVDPVPTHCVQWERGVKVIETDKSIEGNVIINYTEINGDGDFVINTKSVKIRKE